jgi:glutathione reductase (NADPH)
MRRFGWDIEVKGHDGPGWRAPNREIERLSGIYGKLLKGNGVTTFDARATFLDAHTLQVGDRRVTAERILVSTGGTAQKLDIRARSSA